MYVLYDTFNDRIVSRHRKLVAACKANERFQRQIKKNNGANSYIPVDLRILHKDGRLEKLEEGSPDQAFWLTYPHY